MSIKSGDLYMAHRHSNLKKSISKLNASDHEAEDREFALRTDKALKRIEDGKGKKMNAKKFLKELEKW